MKVYKLKDNLNRKIISLKARNKTIGFVPTMGALHKGHLSLVQKAIDNNDIVVVSIFVNPTQFNNQNDLVKYPRTLSRDIDLLKKISEDILVYSPNVEDIYQKNIKSIKFDFDGLEHQMEGKFRNGHFDGVGTIVKYLLEIVKPDNAYFGEKDFQQLQIVKKLVEKFNIPVNVIGCEIYRESNGLAMSSRNERLTPEEKKATSFIYETLMTAKEKFGTESVNKVTEWVVKQFKKHSLLELEYFVIADVDTLKQIKRKSNKKTYRAFIAVYADDIRLIDNIVLN